MLQKSKFKIDYVVIKATENRIFACFDGKNPFFKISKMAFFRNIIPMHLLALSTNAD
jgi:hypothetical protein